jgi:hypothetical protein
MNGEYHVAAMRTIAAHLPVVVSARDRAGFATLIRKAEREGRGEDLYALIAILAESADLGRLAEVTGCEVPPRRGESKPAARRKAA